MLLTFMIIYGTPIVSEDYAMDLHRRFEPSATFLNERVLTLPCPSLHFFSCCRINMARGFSGMSVAGVSACPLQERHAERIVLHD